MRFTLWNLLTAICLLCPLAVALSVGIERAADRRGFIVVAGIGIVIGALWITAMRIAGSRIASRLRTVPIQFQTIWNALLLGGIVGFIILSMIASDQVTTSVLKILSSR